MGSESSVPLWHLMAACTLVAMIRLALKLQGIPSVRVGGGNNTAHCKERLHQRCWLQIVETHRLVELPLSFETH